VVLLEGVQELAEDFLLGLSCRADIGVGLGIIITYSMKRNPCNRLTNNIIEVQNPRLFPVQVREDRIHKVLATPVHQSLDGAHEFPVADRVVMVGVEHIEEELDVVELEADAIVLAALLKLKSRELA